MFVENFMNTRKILQIITSKIRRVTNLIQNYFIYVKCSD